jgi:hypothetical protein
MAATFIVNKVWGKMRGGFAKGPGRAACFLAALILALLWLTPGCAPPTGGEDLKKEVEALKSEVATLKEKVSQVEAAQKILVEMMKARVAAPGVGAGSTELPGLPAPQTLAPGTPLTLDELFKNKDQLLGTRVTVKGLPGPVMMHKKTLFLGGPGGMVEVIYGNLQDKKQVERLTAQNIETPITVSGLLSGAPGQVKGQTRLVIMADSVEF